MKYRVNFETGASIYVEVEAEDREAAVEAAFDALPGSVCAQCSGWGQKWGMDLGDWDLAEEDGKEAPWAIEEVEA